MFTLGLTAPAMSLTSRIQRSKEPILVVLVTLVALVVVLASMTSLGGWGVLAHWTCVGNGPASSQVVYLPLILMNAPYGGNVSGWANLPSSFFGGMVTSMGTKAPNGSVAGVFLHAWVNESENSNETALGPGPNSMCEQKYAISASVYFSKDPLSGVVVASVLGKGGHLSDVGEPQMYNFSSYANSTTDGLTPRFDNGFTSANGGNVSTCNSTFQSVPVHSTGLTVWLTATIGGRFTTVPYWLPFPQVYQYYFPANFGTWQVDNLSAPGGPGGGWAFDYTGPCA